MKNSKIKKFFGRTLSVILTVFLLVGAIPIAEVSATEKTDRFEYILLDDGTIEVTKYIGNDINVVIPEEIDGKIVTKIDAFCFRNNDNRFNIKNITISKNINGFTYSFNGEKSEASGCLQELINLESIVVDKNNQIYASESGILFNKDLTKLLYYPNHKSDEEYVVKSSVSELGRSSISYNVFLKRLKFESFLTFIDEDAITNCKIEEAEYPIYLDSSSYLSLYTFCNNLKKVYISKEVEHMNDEDFMGSPNVVLYVFDNSYGLEWAKEHNFSYEIMEEEPIEKELIDTNTGIKVEGTMDTDAALKVEKLENTFENSVATYDITLQKDGAVIQPDGTITVQIPSNAENCKVMWLKDDGTAEDMNAKYTDGCYVFTTNHLSVYALVQNKQYLKGDANQDGIVNINDVTYLQMHIAGNKNTDGSAFIDETNKQLFDCVDMNKDGKLSVADVTALQIQISQNN
ncbi:hypothetical protein [Ruminococcus sp.]|jgi:hypothetical protein|uniref:hypothetical protein n=1 Tax=Ruminococcus sp. TaxID=41978 RepID=UPI0025F86C98|nr:hypothetical protein [Ruminococcus sp.]